MILANILKIFYGITIINGWRFRLLNEDSYAEVAPDTSGFGEIGEFLKAYLMMMGQKQDGGTLF